MDSSSLGKLKEENGKFRWNGDLESLEKFFQALGYEGIWTQLKNTSKEGKTQYSYKFRHASFCCTWYETTRTLLVQGKKEDEIRKKLKHVVVEPVLLTAPSEAEESENRPTDPNEQKENSDNAELDDGLHRGDKIASLIGMKLKQWVQDKADITIVTPFLDEVGLKFITSHVDQETSIVIYTREQCGWKMKIDELVANAKRSDHWIVNNITALKCIPSFHAKFLAGVCNDRVELVVTSCNMTKEHLELPQLETVMQSECHVDEFQSNWIGPLVEKAAVPPLNMADLSQALPTLKG